MGHYRTPLPRLFAALVESVLKRAIELDPGAAAALDPLESRMLKLELEGPGLDLFFTVADGRLKVTAEADEVPDTVISGTPSALLAMSIPDRRASGNGVKIHGEAELARDFERFMRRLDPDWEAALIERFGKVAGHQLHVFFREGIRAGRAVAETGTDQLAVWLKEESDLLVDRTELKAFTAAVDTLREAVDRLESRIVKDRRG